MLSNACYFSLIRSPCSRFRSPGSRLLYKQLATDLTIYVARGVARIFGLGGQTVPCRAEPDPASTEVVKSMRGVWVLPPKKKLLIRMHEMHFSSIWQPHL